MKNVLRTIRDAAVQQQRRKRASRLGAAFFPPNYVFFDRLGPDSVVVDVGCGHEAELSEHLITTRGVQAFGVDPTRKHAPHLQALEARTDGRFTHLPVAVAAERGTLTFHESVENESGSLLTSHANVTADEIRTYEVETLTLADLAECVGGTADLLKLDLEGAEYALLDGVTGTDLDPFDQVLVEFHHHCVPDRTAEDTHRLTERLKGFGMRTFEISHRDVLFYR
ncbi:MAG: FkbM family methyltransferase [Rhodothermaceae bacterium]|nr:FkbM family methyltransferase [Rhodothermaceae bacterium]